MGMHRRGGHVVDYSMLLVNDEGMLEPHVSSDHSSRIRQVEKCFQKYNNNCWPFIVLDSWAYEHTDKDDKNAVATIYASLISRRRRTVLHQS